MDSHSLHATVHYDFIARGVQSALSSTLFAAMFIVPPFLCYTEPAAYVYGLRGKIVPNHLAAIDLWTTG